MEPDSLTLVMMELEYDNQGIWRYENQEFDDMYPIPEPRTGSPRNEIGRSRSAARVDAWTRTGCRIRSARVALSEQGVPGSVSPEELIQRPSGDTTCCSALHRKSTTQFGSCNLRSLDEQLASLR
jgi:hypothetical protein